VLLAGGAKSLAEAAKPVTLQNSRDHWHSSE
jgi:hypothetical protein